jgi:hypothetical protein
MNPKVRIALYILLVACLVVFGTRLYATYHAPEAPLAPQPSSTNVVLAVTPSLSTNPVAATNPLTTTNQTATAVLEPADDDLTVRRKSPRMGRMMAYGIGMFFALVGLSVLIGHDVSRYLAHRVEDFIFNDNLHGVKDPEYEEAERVFETGQHLEAVRLMRDYLKRHPREQYVALRIAEIYETNLHNPLAAALEYEEILKKKLPAERWGWAAIHLSNLYSGKLNKTEHATKLLRRIVDEYGQTAAAKKARERLGIPEPIVVPEPIAAPAPEPPPPEPVKQESPASNLPPGFRPK